MCYPLSVVLFRLVCDPKQRIIDTLKTFNELKRLDTKDGTLLFFSL